MRVKEDAISYWCGKLFTPECVLYWIYWYKNWQFRGETLKFWHTQAYANYLVSECYEKMTDSRPGEKLQKWRGSRVSDKVTSTQRNIKLFSIWQWRVFWDIKHIWQQRETRLNYCYVAAFLGQFLPFWDYLLGILGSA